MPEANFILCPGCGNRIDSNVLEECNYCGRILPAPSRGPKSAPDTVRLPDLEPGLPTRPLIYQPEPLVVTPVPQAGQNGAASVPPAFQNHPDPGLQPPFQNHPGPGPQSPKPRFKRIDRRWFIVPVVFLVLLLAYPAFLLVHNQVIPSVNVKVPNGLGEFTTSNGDTIGVNDGSYAPFDVWRVKQELAWKQQAAQKVRDGHGSEAIPLWNSALKLDSTDAEALIYEENQFVLESGKPYLTLVVCTAFVSGDASSPQSQLQGVYVAQQELNSSPSPYDLRVLIANSGGDVSSASLVAQQIVNIAGQDKTVIGVVGWLTSSRSSAALTILDHAKIPQVSPQASADKLSGISPYFFRIAPANRVEAPAAAKFAEQTLQVRNPVVFVDLKEPYSQNLAQDFEDQLVKDGYARPYEETFTVNDKNNKAKFAALIQDALKHNPDAFYFTSSSVGDTGLFQDALPTSGPFANLPVISGDAGYAAHPNSYNRWFFTAFAFPDAWNLIVGKDNPPFFQDYSSDFNPDGLKQPGIYGFTRPNDAVMLSYDATQVLLTGIQLALPQGKTTLTPLDLANALPKITGAQAYQGVSGQIAFDAKHDPANKAIEFLYTSADGHLHMKSWQDCFVKGCP